MKNNNIKRCVVHEIRESHDVNSRVLYYEIRTSNGTIIGNTFANKFPMEGDDKISLNDAKEMANLWAEAPQMLDALHRIFHAKTKDKTVSVFSLCKLMEEIRKIASISIKLP